MSAAKKREGQLLSYRWNLRQLMARKEMYSTTDLAAPLKERGVQLSTAQVYRLVTHTPERLNLKVLVALCDILDCTPNDLVEPVAKEANRNKKTDPSAKAQNNAPEDLKPSRARIVDDEPKA